MGWMPRGRTFRTLRFQTVHPLRIEACESAAPQKLPGVTWRSRLEDGGANDAIMR